MKFKLITLPVFFMLYAHQYLDASRVEYAELYNQNQYFKQHPFADMYSIVNEKPIASSQSSRPSHQKSSSSLPQINRPKTAPTNRRFAAIFPSELNLQKLSLASTPESISSDSSQSISIIEPLDLNSNRSTDISDLTSTNQETATTRTITSSSEESSSEESKISMSGTSKFKKKFLRKTSETSTKSYQPAPKYIITPTPEILITNNKNNAAQISLFLHIPFDPYSYNKNDATTYETSSQKVTLQPGEQIKLSMPFYSKLQSIQLAYDPVPQAIEMRNPIFQSRKSFNIAKNNVAVGEKQYAHDIAINDDGIHIDQLSSTTKTSLLDLPLSNSTLSL